MNFRKVIVLSACGLVGTTSVIFAAKELKTDLTNAIQHIGSVTISTGGNRAVMSSSNGNLKIETKNFYMGNDMFIDSNYILGTGSVGITSEGSNNVLVGKNHVIHGGMNNVIIGDQASNMCDLSTCDAELENETNNNVIVGVGNKYKEVGWEGNVVIGDNFKIIGNGNVFLGGGDKQAKIYASNTFVWSDGQTNLRIDQSDNFIVPSKNGMAVNAGEVKGDARLTIGAPLIVSTGTNTFIQCSADLEGSLKLVHKYDSAGNLYENQMCLCSCNGDQWTSIESSPFCDASCLLDETNPHFPESTGGCRSGLNVSITNGVTNIGNACTGDYKLIPDSFLLSGSREDNMAKLRWACQNDLGETKSCSQTFDNFKCVKNSAYTGFNTLIPQHAKWNNNILPSSSQPVQYSTTGSDVCGFQCNEGYTWSNDGGWNCYAPCTGFNGDIIPHGQSITGYKKSEYVCSNECRRDTLKCNNGKWRLGGEEKNLSNYHSTCKTLTGHYILPEEVEEEQPEEVEERQPEEIEERQPEEVEEQQPEEIEERQPEEVEEPQPEEVEEPQPEEREEPQPEEREEQVEKVELAVEFGPCPIGGEDRLFTGWKNIANAYNWCEQYNPSGDLGCSNQIQYAYRCKYRHTRSGDACVPQYCPATGFVVSGVNYRLPETPSGGSTGGVSNANGVSCQLTFRCVQSGSGLEWQVFSNCKCNAGTYSGIKDTYELGTGSMSTSGSYNGKNNGCVGNFSCSLSGWKLDSETCPGLDPVCKGTSENPWIWGIGDACYNPYLYNDNSAVGSGGSNIFTYKCGKSRLGLWRNHGDTCYGKCPANMVWDDVNKGCKCDEGYYPNKTGTGCDIIPSDICSRISAYKCTNGADVVTGSTGGKIGEGATWLCDFENGVKVQECTMGCEILLEVDSTLHNAYCANQECAQCGDEVNTCKKGLPTEFIIEGTPGSNAKTATLRCESDSSIVACRKQGTVEEIGCPEDYIMENGTCKINAKYCGKIKAVGNDGSHINTANYRYTANGRCFGERYTGHLEQSYEAYGQPFPYHLENKNDDGSRGGGYRVWLSEYNNNQNKSSQCHYSGDYKERIMNSSGDEQFNEYGCVLTNYGASDDGYTLTCTHSFKLCGGETLWLDETQETLISGDSCDEQPVVCEEGKIYDNELKRCINLCSKWDDQRITNFTQVIWDQQDLCGSPYFHTSNFGLVKDGRHRIYEWDCSYQNKTAHCRTFYECVDGYEHLSNGECVKECEPGYERGADGLCYKFKCDCPDGWGDPKPQDRRISCLGLSDRECTVLDCQDDDLSYGMVYVCYHR